MGEPRILREVVGDEPPKAPKVVLTADVQALVDAGAITEQQARAALAKGRTPRLLLEG